MKALREVFRLFVDVLFPSPEQRAYERQKKVVHVCAHHQSQAEYHRLLADFYTERVMSIDPHTDWWAFAEAKQKQYDHQTECLLYTQRAEQHRLTEAQ